MPHHYFIQFRTPGGGVHTRVIETEFTIEYESDIVQVQDQAAREVKASDAMLLSWVKLSGRTRPASSTSPAEDRGYTDAFRLTDAAVAKVSGKASEQQF